MQQFRVASSQALPTNLTITEHVWLLPAHRETTRYFFEFLSFLAGPDAHSDLTPSTLGSVFGTVVMTREVAGETLDQYHNMVDESATAEAAVHTMIEEFQAIFTVAAADDTWLPLYFDNPSLTKHDALPTQMTNEEHLEALSLECADRVKEAATRDVVVERTVGLLWQYKMMAMR